MTAFESPEFVDLFTTYTAGPTSIGAHFAETAMRSTADDPLIVATGTDIAVFPSEGAAPTVESYRLARRGFKELAAVSHLGPAMAALAQMREQDPDGCWREDAARLLSACKAARAANTIELWRDAIAVPAFVGREEAITAMVDYSCLITERRLTLALDEPASLTVSALREELFDGPADGLPVPLNRVMVATFFLTGMDIAHRLITWFDSLDIDWTRAMVIIAGRAGRVTAGVTEESNSVAGVVRAASRGRLARDRLFIAPHAPVFPAFDGSNVRAVAASEHEYRLLWSSLHATSELGAQMFAGYPRFEPLSAERPQVRPGMTSVHEKPALDSPDDWFALTTRLRVVMEDPRQLLSGAVTDFASRQLVDAANNPLAVSVPGLDGEHYPQLDEGSRND